MKFCDKLQKIRKENNMTQEGLADKLNVSRQAVSKWENGTTYPDTEKLIQISKLFNVGLDELVNDNKGIDMHNDFKEKLNINETIKLISDFCSKTFSMFWAMTFREKIKCLFEMGILVLAILFVSSIANAIILEIIRKVFLFLPRNILYNICTLMDALLYVVWIVLGFLIFIKILKTRYLDYYVIIDDDSVDKTVIEEPIKELKERKDYKVVIRDPNDSSFNFFGKIWESIIFIIKILAIFMLIPIIISFITTVILLVISLSYLFEGMFFNGISIALLGTIIFIYLFILFIYNLIFNQENNYKLIFLLFIISISLVGTGFGLSFISLSDYTIISDSMGTINSYELEYDSNLVFPEITSLSLDQIVIDNNLDNIIKIDLKEYYLSDVNIYTYYMDKNNQPYKMVDISYNYNSFEMYKKIIDDLKTKKLSKYYHEYKIDKIYISESHLTQLKENNDKYFNSYH